MSLDATADREISGTASVWRFSAGSIRRALETGRTPDEVSAELTAIAEGALPQPLAYLIADAARRHGHVRVAPAACVIHGVEPALLAELAAHQGLAALGLRQLAPTVLPRKVTTKAGTGRSAPRPAEASAAVDSYALVARLLTAPPAAPETNPFGTGVPFGTDTEEIVAGCAKQLTYADVRQLAHAIDTGAAITVEYVAASGSHTVRTLSHLGLDPPYLEAWCHLRDSERVFTLSRIHGVMPA